MSESTRLEADLQIVNARIEAVRHQVGELTIELRDLLNEVRRIAAILNGIKL